jgi:beta-lactamase regulating signal transducer with metallopeptidase domain
MAFIDFPGLLGGAAVKAAVILAIAGLVAVAWRRGSAASRHLVWTLGVAASLAIPAMSAAIAKLGAPRIEIAAWTERDQPAANLAAGEAPVSSLDPAANPEIFVSPRESGSIESEPAIVVSKTGAATPEVSARRSAIDWRSLLFPIWLAGAALALLPLLVAQIRVRSIARNARPAGKRWNDLVTSTPSISGFAGRVRMLESADAQMPMTWGVTRPTLLVPGRSDKWADWQCRDILLHEIAHVQRRDCLTQLVAHIACAVYWFNPLAWIAAHRMRVERELACDDRVINSGSRASDYASNLLDVARSLRAPSMTSHTAIAMARPSQLSGRLLAVLDNRRNRRTVTRGLAAGTSFAAIAVALAVASLAPASAASASLASTRESASVPAVEEIPSPAPEVVTAFPSSPAAIVRAIQLPEVRVLTPISDKPLELKPKLSSPALPAILAQDPGCWDDGDGNTNVSVNTSNHDRRNQSYTVKYARDNCSLELRAEGEFKLRPDLSDIESISGDGWIRIEERIGRSTKRVEIRRGDNGSLEHLYYVNGDRAAYDSNARAWLARTLLSVERRTAFAAETRVPQLYRSGGLRAVLSEISAMRSAYPRSKYYGTLLDTGIDLDANSLNGIVRQATVDLASSDYYLSQVLGELGKQRAANETTWRSFAEAAGRMKSDYYRAQMLKKILGKGQLSSSTVGLLLRSTSGMKSDYYITDLLKEVASKYAMNADTRQYYADALRSVESDYYRMELLKAMGSEGEWDSGTSRYVLESAGEIKSDYYKSESLKSLARGKHVDSWPTFFAAAGTIGSDYYRKETLKTALQHEPLTREIVTGVIGVASRFKSDSEKADLLQSVARSYKLDGALREAYEKAVDTMDSDYYRGAALSALRRSMARGS